jgi:hypothetical protein
VFWQTRKLDFLMVTLVANRTITMIVAGWVVILFAGFLIGWRMKRAGKAQRIA